MQFYGNKFNGANEKKQQQTKLNNKQKFFKQKPK